MSHRLSFVLFLLLMSTDIRAQTRSSPTCRITDWPMGQVLAAPGGEPSGLASGDFDGDGLLDLVRASSFEAPGGGNFRGVVAVWRGIPGGFDPTPATVIEGQLNEQFGYSLAAAGDVNGDGFDDIVVGTAGTTQRRAYLYVGGPSGLSGPAWSFAASGLPEYGTHRVVVGALGDVNGDGYDDFGVIVLRVPPIPAVSVWQILAFHGGPSGPSATPDVVIPAPYDYWARVVGVGDINGDGYGDIAARAGSTHDAVVRIYFGSAAGLGTTAVAEERGTVFSSDLGRGLAAAGDMDGDGLDDFVMSEPGSYSVTTPDTGGVRLHRWTGSGIARVWESLQDPRDQLLGLAVLAPGDLDGDGWNDIVGTAEFRLPRIPSLTIAGIGAWFGSPAGLAPRPALVAVQPPDMRALGWMLASAGDVDGDGRSDIAATAILRSGASVVLVIPGAEPNDAPDVRAGPDVTIDCGQVNVRAVASDINGDALAYLWESDCGEATFIPSAEVPAPTVTFDPGCGRECKLTVLVDDGRCGLATDTIAVRVDDRSPPGLRGLPPDVAVACDAVPAPAPVTTDDACDPAPTLGFAEVRRDGPCPWSYEVERRWMATDSCGNETTGGHVLTVVDDVAPVVVGARGALRCLWPPNGRIARFRLDEFSPRALDNCDPSPNLLLAGCEALEDGLPVADAATECGVSADGREIWVRSRRSGAARDGRQYAVIVRAEDACGNRSATDVIGFIHVPHDNRPGKRCP